MILCTMLAGLIALRLQHYLGIVRHLRVACGRYLRTAEIQNQCTISKQSAARHTDYLSDPTSEVIDANLTQLTNIYNGQGYDHG